MSFVCTSFPSSILPNHFVEKLLAQLKGEERDAFIEDMKPQLISLKKYNYGKQIAAIEKLIFTGPHPYTTPTSALVPSAPSVPIEIASNAPTPLLTNGQNSPQSSSLPSTSVSTIDEPADSTSVSRKTSDVVEKALPEVVISGI